MSPARLLVFLTLLLTAVGLTVAPMGIASAQNPDTRQAGEPNLNVLLPNNQLVVGATDEAGILEFYIQNNGELSSGTDRSIAAARAVEVPIDDPGPFDLNSATTPIGTIQDGSTMTAEKRFEVPADVDPGQYEISVEVRYRYTNELRQYLAGPDQTIDESTTESHDVTIEVIDERRFAIVGVTSDVEPGGTGTATMTVENIADEPASTIHGTIAPTGEGGLAFDGGAADVSLDDLEPDEQTTVAVDVAVEDGVSDDQKPIEASLYYTDDTGVDRPATPPTAQIDIDTSTSRFAVTDVTSDVEPGGSGGTAVTIEHVGDTPVIDVHGSIMPAESSPRDSSRAMPSNTIS